MDILCVTGTRADYGIYRPLLFELNNSTELNLKLIVTGMHLLEEYGLTISDIKQDQFYIEATPSILLRGDSTQTMSQSIGIALLYFSEILERIRPKAVLLLGDRGEMLAAAIAAHYQNVPIVHLHGGERSGSADDAVRHSISKLAHLHFVSTYQSKQNLCRMGEEGWRIVPFGSLRKHDIEALQQLDQGTKQGWINKYGLKSNQKKILFVMHPDSKDIIPYETQINEVISSLEGLDQVQIIVIGSNSDAGGEVFNQRLSRFVNENSNASYYLSVPAIEYLYLLSQVDLLIGNSSSGIIEAPFFQLPVVSVGLRQYLREQGGNVQQMDYNQNKIREVVLQLIHLLDKEKKARLILNPYDITSSPKKVISKHLLLLLDHPQLLNKKLEWN